MRTTTFLLALAAGSAVTAIPTKRETNFGGASGPLGGLLGGGPASGLGDSAQAAIAEVFKAVDAVLNIPGDAAGKLLEGDPVGAGTQLVSDVAKLGTDLPKDAMGIISPLIQV